MSAPEIETEQLTIEDIGIPLFDDREMLEFLCHSVGLLLAIRAMELNKQPFNRKEIALEFGERSTILLAQTEARERE